jgi:aquaglyceroporin related protein
MIEDRNGSQVQLQQPSKPTRQQSSADFQPPNLQHQQSSASSYFGRNARATAQSSDQPRPGHDRSNTASMRLRRAGTSMTNRTNNTNNTGNLYNAHERAEKKQEQTVDIENEYFALNPWYNQQKKKPVFGLAAPLPRTVRRGMWWGRGDLQKSMYKVDEEQDDDGIEKHDALDFSRQPGELHPYSSHLMDIAADTCSNRYWR